MSQQGEWAKQRAKDHEQRIAAMSDHELRNAALMMVYLVYGHRALSFIGYQVQA
jgi:hypothetical protein